MTAIMDAVTFGRWSVSQAVHRGKWPIGLPLYGQAVGQAGGQSYSMDREWTTNSTTMNIFLNSLNFFINIFHIFQLL